MDGRTGRGGNHALYFLTALIGNQVLLQRASQATHKGDMQSQNQHWTLLRKKINKHKGFHKDPQNSILAKENQSRELYITI